MNISILLFAHLKEKVGSNRITLEVPHGSTVGELKKTLVEQYPALRAQLNKVLVSINQKVVLDEDIIEDGAEIAIFPPVSGGSDRAVTIVKIVDEELDQNTLIRQLNTENIGAVCTFTGLVRQITSRDERPYETTAIEYEAYKPMAEKQLAKIAEEIRERWPDVEGIGIIQRTGYLTAGTPSVLVACSASHRDTGVFEASRYGIDRLKEIVPVWKKEERPEGDRWIDGQYQMQPGDS